MITAQLFFGKTQSQLELNFSGIGCAVTPCSNSEMDRYEHRRANLMALLKDRFSGNQAKLAEKLEVKPPAVSRWLNPDAEKRQNIDDKSAAKIEEKLELEYLWLDQEHHLNNVVRNAAKAMMKLPAADQVALLHWIQVEIAKGGHPPPANPPVADAKKQRH